MSEIPDDIRHTAATTVFDLETRIQSGEFSDPSGFGFSVLLVSTFEAVIQAERQRCWALTNQYAADHGLKHEHDSNGAVVDQTCADICKAIRMGDERKGE